MDWDFITVEFIIVSCIVIMIYEVIQLGKDDKD